ncbi:histidine kinase [Curvibacter sp. APW13]|uniref:hybrid sensor histidine kinase/response regulator n=1 Tax=Curvibacter sp. APW13 TaxID=3077236 RepID=UPI0028DF6C2E|nr:ATP-binding protein [Curvibacter sp. APW13]MDT8992916.1 histidine kinase [Curvibacter sp. APW13]
MKILHLEDSPLDHALTLGALRRAGLSWDLRQVDSLEAFEAATGEVDVDLVLADYQLPGFTALDAWSRFPSDRERPPFVLLSGAIGEAAAVQAIQQGFADYLSKSDLQRLPHVVQRAVEFAAHQRAKERADRALAESQQHLARLTAHLQEVIEHERLSIAREVHDDIGAALTAAKLDVAWLQRRSESEQNRSHTESALASIQSAMDACRRLMLNLRPSVLDEGLAPAIRWLANDFSRRNDLPVSLRIREPLAPLPSNTMLVAFRTTQESLTNVAKHAQCTRVTIDVSSDEGVLTVEVTDNGQGMERHATQKAQSFGLRGLHERAQSVEGWLDVSSAPGQGTSITLSIPLGSANAPDQENAP